MAVPSVDTTVLVYYSLAESKIWKPMILHFHWQPAPSCTLEPSGHSWQCVTRTDETLRLTLWHWMEVTVLWFTNSTTIITWLVVLLFSMSTRVMESLGTCHDDTMMAVCHNEIEWKWLCFDLRTPPPSSHGWWCCCSWCPPGWWSHQWNPDVSISIWEWMALILWLTSNKIKCCLQIPQMRLRDVSIFL